MQVNKQTAQGHALEWDLNPEHLVLITSPHCLPGCFHFSLAVLNFPAPINVYHLPDSRCVPQQTVIQSSHFGFSVTPVNLHLSDNTVTVKILEPCLNLIKVVSGHQTAAVITTKKTEKYMFRRVRFFLLSTVGEKDRGRM